MKNKNRVWKSLSAISMTAAMVLATIPFSSKPVKADTTWPTGPSVDSEAAIVMEVNTGTILYEKNVHEQLYPASITKIMTSYLALENCNLDETVFFSHDAVYKNEGNSSHIAREWKEELSVRSVLYAVMLESANECAYALAEHVAGLYGGDYDYFVEMMNDKAKELGCTDTHFNNANGLPDENHYTSAYDMALISSAAYKNETFRIIAGSRSYTIDDTNMDRDDYYCSNHHQMLKPSSSNYYKYCTGGKTGYTTVAKNTLVTYAEKDGLTLVCVIMKSDNSQYTDTRTLLDYCFENYKAVNILENDESIVDQTLTDTGVLNNCDPFVGLDESAYIVLPVTADFKDTKMDILDGTGKRVLARFQYSYGEHVVGTVDLIATGAQVDENYFTKDAAETKTDENVKVVEIKPLYIIVGVLAIVVLILLIYYIKKFADNFYVIKHQFNEYRQKHNKGRSTRKRSRRVRKSKRMYK